MARLLPIDHSEIARVCERFGVATLRITGSDLLDDEASPTSSITFLVEFAPEAQRDFASFFALGDELQRTVGRPVELFDRRALRSPSAAPSLTGTEIVYPV
ncbi:hypothetical protein [Brevibacterium sp.]|uniref:hypothetical protein n=1 Tax=Brevibacterium sp. TaxID=1701 RepID=UPI002811C47A|nr:hypothetical protein [Brevibacterium sp.]